MERIQMVAFDADDTLWRSQDYFDQAQHEFEQIIAAWVDLDEGRLRQRLYEVECGNIGVFGYGVKGMVLSMLEAAVELTQARISAADLQRIVGLGKALLQHPVELLPDIREAVETIARDYAIVLITKGDLFHQEAKVRQSGMADLFRRIEIVSEKDPPTYKRLLAEFELPASRFLMIGNSLRSDIAPVLALGGWGIHVPYHTTWAHENAVLPDSSSVPSRMRRVDAAAGLPGAVAELSALAAMPNAC